MAVFRFSLQHRESAMKSKKLKLYVWEDVLRDYTSGIMVALAYSVSEARSLIREDQGWAKGSHYSATELSKKPKVVTKPECFVLWGGG